MLLFFGELSRIDSTLELIGNEQCLVAAYGQSKTQLSAERAVVSRGGKLPEVSKAAIRLSRVE